MRCNVVWALALLGALAASTTHAEPRHPRPAADSATLHVIAGEATSVPFGWADFCSRTESDGDCNVATLAAADAVMDARAWGIARRINLTVNMTVEPVSDMENYGVVDYWTYPNNGKGDCEDYALQKRRELMKAGFPREALLMTVVRDQEGEGHAVLMLKTTSGDFVLDNKVNEIRRWTRTGYHFVKRQSQENPNVWVSLHEPDVTVVASTGKRR
jgi:predicted transglutaminase-like cysteine proteinase